MLRCIPLHTAIHEDDLWSCMEFIQDFKRLLQTSLAMRS